jgi:predicted nucleic acid-binding protein
MTYLFDTDTLSNLLKRAPSTTLLARLAATPLAAQATTAINLGELVYGATRLGPRGAALRERIEQILVAELTILPFDAAAARRYGPLRADLERQGLPLAEADLRIAAIALAHGRIVVTANTRHFGRVGELVVENWIA